MFAAENNGWLIRITYRLGQRGLEKINGGESYLSTFITIMHLPEIVRIFLDIRYTSLQII